MTLLPVARVFRSVIRIKFFLSSLSFNLMPYFTHAYRFSKKCTRLFSPREVILLRGSLSIILPSLCCALLSFLDVNITGWKYYSPKMQRNRVSRAKLVKVAKFFAFYFRRSISFPGNNCDARIQHVLPFLLFFTRRVDPCLESCEPEQRAGARGNVERIAPRINGGEALSRWRRRTTRFQLLLPSFSGSRLITCLQRNPSEVVVVRQD